MVDRAPPSRSHVEFAPQAREQGDHPDYPRERDRMYATDPAPHPDREKSSREIAQDILSRQLAEDQAADRRAEARQGDRARAQEEHYRERGY